MLKHLCSLLFFLAFSINQLPARKFGRNDFVVMTGSDGGMFNIFDGVADLIKCHERRKCRGIEIDFGTRGLYYEASHGNNWWSYYCEPISIGKKKNIKKIRGRNPFSEESFFRHETFRLIQKYFQIKPHILNKIDTFEKENFKDYFVLSVHYRGTDKIAEAPHVPYQKVSEEIYNVMMMYGNKNYKIFVATDEQAFLTYMVTLFGNLVCYKQDTLRSISGTPVHLDKNFSRYQCGEDALIDCILLSRGNYLIRSDSNMSRWSTYFNPNIPVVKLNTEYPYRK